MSIYIRQLSPLVYSALERLCSKNGWPEIHEWMEPQDVAWLTYRLRYVADDDETFPNGKWATIQRMQEILEKAAQKDSMEWGSEGT